MEAWRAGRVSDDRGTTLPLAGVAFSWKASSAAGEAMPTPAEPVFTPRSSGYARAVDANSDEKAWKIETRELTLEALTCGRVLYTEVNTVLFYVDPGRHDAVSRKDVEE
jgi:hypothetical protein